MTAVLPTFDPVARTTVTEQVYRRLRDGLMSGRFAPGQKLAIRGLAAALGSSPMPIREALHRLQAEGAIEITPTGRIRVASLDPVQLREVRDTRMALEGMLAERAAAAATAADRLEIDALFDAMQRSVEAGDRSGYLEANFAFHRRIYVVADAAITLRIVESLWLLMGPCFYLLTPERAHLHRSMAAHRDIREAMRNGDGPAARAAVCDDILQAAGSLARLLVARAEG
ncbi:GntR family transcriptional regulator [Chenggangzhangella methanolivorans]|uniref:GntR family transcriptional regulator n=1 Tax=Chenggangzhangella methanolivorans TaxID=1437009 RepID=A0A9E6ULZ1_9HYPH|nr:GntR family transcriptional regulator [Chenggangzhangella methanolivorans]QZN98638.1 GntR family transcriptional regulator [Chenggangzhangella methanolivorans]